jgi:UPF0755 protein
MPSAPARIVLLAVGLAVAVEVWRLATPTSALQAGPQRVEIPPDNGLLGVAGALRDAGLIRSPLGFAALALVRGDARQLKAGEYDVPQGAAAHEILALIASGRVVQHPVLLPEGGTVRELAQTLEAERLASADDVNRRARDPRLLQSLGIEAASLEGYLFPDTYRVVRGEPAEDILRRMVARLHEKVTPAIRGRARQRGLGLHELLTLASIIEREAVVSEELALISAVFWNRLRRDMPLQADPTVQYAVGKGRLALTRADLRVDDPYNTYRRPGLPPGPIASPGLAAIEAALAPAPVDYLYFVSIDDRRHFFSSTIRQHNAAVARYRLARTR